MECTNIIENKLKFMLYSDAIVEFRKCRHKFKMLNHRRLRQDDFEKPCKVLALYLLGKILVRKLDTGYILKGKIVETESYLGEEDKASHSYNNRRTAANEPMFMLPGTSYVYMTYGMYHCFNISSEEPGAAVLIRALEPISGIEIMEALRESKLKKGPRAFKINELCNGPSKLCIAMDINKNLNKINIAHLENDQMWIEDDPEVDINALKIIATSRIGIPRAGDWVNKPLRYYILNNACVSKKDKNAEREFQDNDEISPYFS